MKPRSMASNAPPMLLMAKGMQKGFIFLKPCSSKSRWQVAEAGGCICPDQELCECPAERTRCSGIQQKRQRHSVHSIGHDRKPARLVGQVLHSSGEGGHAPHGCAHEHAAAAGVQL